MGRRGSAEVQNKRNARPHTNDEAALIAMAKDDEYAYKRTGTWLSASDCQAYVKLNMAKGEGFPGNEVRCGMPHYIIPGDPNSGFRSGNAGETHLHVTSAVKHVPFATTISSKENALRNAIAAGTLKRRNSDEELDDARKMFEPKRLKKENPAFIEMEKDRMDGGQQSKRGDSRIGCVP